jgi:hypothetical protein
MYAASLRYDPEPFQNIPRHVLMAALRAEGIPINPPYPVVYRSNLWRPGRELLSRDGGNDASANLGLAASCPVAERISEVEGLTLPHELFLASSEDVADIAEAFAKVQRNASELHSSDWKSWVARPASRLLTWFSRSTSR